MYRYLLVVGTLKQNTSTLNWYIKKKKNYSRYDLRSIRRPEIHYFFYCSLFHTNCTLFQCSFLRIRFLCFLFWNFLEWGKLHNCGIFISCKMTCKSQHFIHKYIYMYCIKFNKRIFLLK